jgi:anti-sigma regulatory factor (Ser/Thr protein kinase)
MFVTCLYGILDPRTGRLRFANAGQNLPFVRDDEGAHELDARGMPLGLMPGMTYAETEAQLAPGQQVLLHSDGIAEAHDPQRDMFGIPRLHDVVAAPQERRGGLIANVLAELERFTGAGWEQEDDITLVALSWAPQQTLADFSVPSEPGREREVMRRAGEVAADFGLSGERLEGLKTAVAEATMNAIEHGNRNDPVLPVTIRVVTSGDELTVRISDEGGERPIPISEAPDIEAKLRGEQKPRGWGLFLIQNMVDAMRVTTHDGRHTVELVVRRRPSATQEPIVPQGTAQEGTTHD